MNWRGFETIACWPLQRRCAIAPRSRRPTDSTLARSKFHARHHRRHGPDPVVHPRGHAPRSHPHAVRRSVVGAGVRRARRTPCDLPCAARAWPHDTAAPRQLPREFMGAEGRRARRAVLAVASVGGIRGCAPGDLVLPHQLIDYTSGRAHTFFDGGDQQVVHAISPIRTRSACARYAWPARGAAGIALRDGGVYGAVCGPRLETAAEIDRMDRDGATLVGMTGMPEAGARARTGRRLCVGVRGGQSCGGPRRQHGARVDGKHRERARKRDGQGARADPARRAARAIGAARAGAPDHRPIEPEVTHDDP